MAVVSMTNFKVLDYFKSKTLSLSLLLAFFLSFFFIGCGGGGGESSSSSSGTMPTIEEGFPWLTGGVKRGERNRVYRVSEAELNRFLGALSGFTYDDAGSTSSTTFYRKDGIPYAPPGYIPNVKYDATVGIRSLGAPMGGGYMVMLWIENGDGDVNPGYVWSGLFNDIFGPIGGVFSHAGADRTFTGDRHSSFYSYAYDLEKDRFKITPTDDNERAKGNIDAKKEDNIAIYLWKGSISPAFLNISIGIWDISKTGYANL
jgi:hypothetical protein